MMGRRKILILALIVASISIVLIIVIGLMSGKTNLTFILNIPSVLKDLHVEFEIALSNCLEGCVGIVDYPKQNRITFEKLKPGKYIYTVKAFGNEIMTGTVSIEKRRIFGGPREKIQSLNIPNPGNIVELSYNVLDLDDLKISWTYEGWVPVEKYRLFIGEKEIGTSTENFFILSHSLIPEPNKPGKRELKLKVIAQFEALNLAEGDLTIPDFVSKIKIEGLEKFLVSKGNILLKIGKRDYKLVEPEILFGRFKENVTVPLTILFKEFEIFHENLNLSSSPEISVKLPHFPKIENLSLRIMGNRMRLEWKIGKSELNLPKPDYVVSVDGHRTIVRNEFFEMDYTEKSIGITVIPRFFDEILGEGAVLQKPEAPRLKVEYQRETVDPKIPLKMKVISPLDCRVFMRELLPKEGKWEEITGKDLVMLNLPEFEKYVFEFEIVDSIGQRKLQRITVERLKPQEVKIKKVFLDVDELIVEWGPINNFYERYTLVFQDQAGEKVKVMETKDFTGKIKTTNLSIENSKITLYGMVFGRSIKLDEKTLKMKSKMEDYVKLKIDKFWAPPQGLIEYKLSPVEKFEHLRIKVEDLSNKTLMDKILKTREGVMSWNAQPGNIYYISVEYRSEESHLVSKRILKFFPEKPGIIEIYQTDFGKFKCVASDFGKWADYIWVVEFKGKKREFKTSDNDLEVDLGINRDEYKDSMKVKVSLKIRHRVTGDSFSDSKDLVLIKAEKYFYDDITKPTVLKDMDDLYISRTIEVKDELRMENLNVRLAPNCSLRVFGKVELNLVNMKPAILGEYWDGFKIFEGSKLVVKNTVVQGVNVFIDSLGSNVEIFDSDLKKFNIGVFSNRSKVQIESFRVREGGVFMKSSESQIELLKLDLSKLRAGFYSKYDKFIQMSGIKFNKVAYPLNSVGTESINVVDTSVVGGSIGFEVEDVKLKVRNLKILETTVGMILTNSEVLIDNLVTENLDLSVDSKYSYVEMKNSHLNSINGMSFITSPVVKKEKYEDGFIAGILKDSSIFSKNKALEIVSGENSILVENVEIRGEIVDGGYFMDIRGMVVKRGKFVFK